MFRHYEEVTPNLIYLKGSVPFLFVSLSFASSTRENMQVGRMNLSGEQEDFEMSCEILGKTYSVITKLPSNKFLINHIFAIALNGILIIPTILLNAVPIITILKSSQLNSKPCYFIILIQSVHDLAVGIFGMPLFLVYLASGIGGNSNCIAATLAFRAMTLPMGTIHVHSICSDIGKIHCYFTSLCLQNSSDEEETVDIRMYRCCGDVFFDHCLFSQQDTDICSNCIRNTYFLLHCIRLHKNIFGREKVGSFGKQTT